MALFKKDNSGQWAETTKAELVEGDEFKEVKPTKYGDLIIEGTYSEPPPDETVA